MNSRLESIEEFEYFLDDLKLLIKVGKRYDKEQKQNLYYAKTDYKNILSISESREKAIEYCLKKVKFKNAILKGDIKVMNEEEGIIIAKKAFKEHFANRPDINKIVPHLSFNLGTDDELLTINITYSKEYKFQESIKKLPAVFAMIFVNLVTGKCEVLENKKIDMISD